MLRKIRKVLLWIMIGMVVLLVTIIFTISPIAKYAVEKYGEKYTGRKITMTSLTINLLKLDVEVDGLKIYEAGSDSIFFSTSKLHANSSFFGLLSGNNQIEPIEIVSPNLIIEQFNGHYNFDDLMNRFLSEDSTAVKTDTSVAENVKYRISSISLTGGQITYRDKNVGEEVVIQNLNLECPQFSSDNPEIMANTDFSIKTGGALRGSLKMNLVAMDYSLDANVDSLNLELVYPYLHDFIKTSYAGGLLNSHLLVRGNFNDSDAFALKGNIGLANFKVDDEENQEVASWQNFEINIDSLNPKAEIIKFGEISIDTPYLLVELYEKTNNFLKMMVVPESDSTVVLAADSMSVDTIDYSNPFVMLYDYIIEYSREYLIKKYTAQNFIIRNGHIVYRDFTLEDKFVYDLENLELKSGQIDSQNDSINFELSCLSNRSGILNAQLAFDPRDFSNMSINYSIENMRIADFNPYSKFYVAHAFVEGSLFYYSTNKIHNGILASTNKFNINKIEVRREVKGRALYALPLKLAIALLRNKDGNIVLDVPVDGDLNDPNYHIGKIVWQIFRNIITKAVTAPFRLLANAFNADEEVLKQFRFDYLQHIFDNRQQKSLDLVAKSLEAKPELNVALVQFASHETEKEVLALTESKKRYYAEGIAHIDKDSLSSNDLRKANDISTRDSLYTVWLNTKLLPNDFSLEPNEQKSRKLLGEDWLALQVDTLFAQRNRSIVGYLTTVKMIDPKRIKISNTDDEETAKFESTPLYKIVFFVDDEAAPQAAKESGTNPKP